MLLMSTQHVKMMKNWHTRYACYSNGPLSTIFAYHAIFVVCVLFISTIRASDPSTCMSLAEPSEPERTWDRYTSDVSNDPHAKARILDYFVKTLPHEVSINPGISASIIDIEYYNHLAGIRGFKKLPDDIHVAYLLYTHRNIHKSLEFDPNRHRARWKTVRSAIDKVFTTSMFSVMIRDDFSESSLWCSKFEYEVEPLHDLTSNAYDEATKLALYLELSKTTLSRADHYDVMSLANATPDIALIGYQDNSSDQDDIVVIVHRTRGSWIQIASLLTIKLLDQKSSPVKYILDKDMSVFNSCYEKLGSMLDHIGGFWSNAWRDMCVKPELLNNHARLTFEDYLWEFFNVNIAGLHPYQQSVLMVLCGALHEAFYAMRSEDKKPIEGEVLLKMYSNDKCTGPYLSLVSHMLSSRVMKSSFLSNALKDVDATRVEYILGIWVAYVSSVHMMRAQLEYVDFNDYMMSISPVPMLTYTQKMLLSFMGGIAVLSFLTALIMGIIRCGRHRTILLVQRQQDMMFDSGSVGDDDSDLMSSARNEDTVR